MIAVIGALGLAGIVLTYGKIAGWHDLTWWACLRPLIAAYFIASLILIIGWLAKL